MYYLKKSATTTTPSHEQNLELFQLLETAKSRINELKANPEVHAGELLHLEKTAEKTREKLILANQGLVVSIARRHENPWMGLRDLIAEGQFGLMTAIDKFDCRRGCRFSTHAFLWIKQAISRALSNQSRTIRIPEARLSEIRKVKDVVERLREDSYGEPTVEEVAWAMDLPESKVRALLTLDKQTVSIDAPLGDADGAAIINFIAVAFAVDPAEEADTANQRELLNEAFKTLAEREREVLGLYYGLNGVREHTLEEIGRKLGVTRERIRQIKEKSEEKLGEFRIAKEGKGAAKAAKTAAANPKKPSPLTVVPSAPTAAKPKVYRLKMRGVEKNPNHHIWNNNGTWYCKFVLILANSERSVICNSLDTKDVEVARRKRDVLIRLYNEPARPEAA